MFAEKTVVAASPRSAGQAGSQARRERPNSLRSFGNGGAIPASVSERSLRAEQSDGRPSRASRRRARPTASASLYLELLDLASQRIPVHAERRGRFPEIAVVLTHDLRD